MKEEEIQKDIDESQMYCPHCNGCGYTGCDGIKTFLKVHVKNKTNCEHEDMYLEDILQTYKILEEQDDIQENTDSMEEKLEQLLTP